MAGPTQKPNAPQSGTLMRALFEPKTVHDIGLVPKIISYSLLVFWALVVIGPLYWVLVTSLKLPVQVNDGPDYFPFFDFEPSLHAWKFILVEHFGDMARPFMNSLIVAGLATILAVMIGAFAAYALVRVRYRIRLATVLSVVGGVAATLLCRFVGGLGWVLCLAIGLAVLFICITTVLRRLKAELGNNDILFWIISNRILPPVVVVLPIYLMFQKVGLIDTYTALILTYIAVNLPIAIWLMRDFFAGIPIDLEESAEIDGAHKFEVFWSIVLPLTKPGLVATALLIFILSWNEYLLALFLATTDTQTMPLLVAAQNATRGPQWWTMSALIIIMIVPVLLLALSLQKHIARGLLMGAVKG